jgi:hypothetical protein
MKHLVRFNESLQITEDDILENFLFISDKFGEPEIYSQKYGGKKKWTLTWSTKIDITVLQEAEEFIKNLKKITEDIDDVFSAAGRLEGFNFNMSLRDVLTIQLVPKDTGDEEFKFIKGFNQHVIGHAVYNSRELKVRINEIERFFNSKGMRVVDWDLDGSYNEYNQTNDLEILLDKVDVEVIDQFKRMVGEELGLIDDRDYICHSSGKRIYISPTEEKSYVSVEDN